MAPTLLLLLRVVLVAAVVMAALLCPLSLALAQDEPPPGVAVDAPDVVTLRLTHPSPTTTLPVDVDDGAELTGEVRATFVGLDDIRTGELAEHLSVSIDTDRALVTVGLVAVDGLFPSPGTYRVLLEIGWRSPPGATRTARAVVGLVVPAAVVSATSDLQITRVVTCPLWFCLGSPADHAEPLVLTETSGVASLPRVEGRVVNRSTGDAAVPELTVALGDAVVVDADQATEVPYTIRGDLPIGTTSATLELTSPAAAASVAVPVTVTVQQSGWTYLLLVAVGLGAGLLVRSRLVGGIEQADVEEAFRRRRAELVAALEGSGDEVLRRALHDIIAAMDGVFVDDADLAARKTAVDTTTGQEATAREALAERTATVSQDRNALADDLDALGGFAVFRGPVAAAVAGLGAVDRLLQMGAVSMADTELHALRISATAQVLAVAGEWVSALSFAYGRLHRGEIPTLPAAAALRHDALPEGATAVRTATTLPAVREGAPSLDRGSAGLLVALRTVLSVGRAVRDGVPRGKDPALEPALADLADQVAALDATPTGPAVWQAVDAAGRVSEALSQTMTAASADHPKQNAIDEAHREGRYHDALALLSDRGPPVLDAAGRPLGDTAADEEPLAAIEPGPRAGRVADRAPLPGPPAEPAQTWSAGRRRLAKVALAVLGLVAVGGAAYVVLPS
ncbi:MAG TPA: hypothetical protein VMM13_19280, partial [Euzebya sp.]|nr:hypothetical protein [Euzebya sp.]